MTKKSVVEVRVVDKCSINWLPTKWAASLELDDYRTLLAGINLVEAVCHWVVIPAGFPSVPP